MRHCEDLHKQQVADLNTANQELQQSFEKVCTATSQQPVPPY